MMPIKLASIFGSAVRLLVLLQNVHEKVICLYLVAWRNESYWTFTVSTSRSIRTACNHSDSLSWTYVVTSAPNLLLFTKFHQNLAIFHWDVEIIFKIADFLFVVNRDHSLKLLSLFFEKIAFSRFGDRQTDKQTEKQTDGHHHCVKPPLAINNEWFEFNLCNIFTLLHFQRFY